MSETEKHRWLPQFCSMPTLFALMVVAEIVALVIAMAPDRASRSWLGELAIASVFVQWLALLNAVVLCSSRESLQRLPFAPITQPQELFDDPHLNQTGGLAAMTLPDGRATKVALLPLAMNGQRLGLRRDPPKLGEHSDELLLAVGYSVDEIAGLRASGVVA